MIMVGIRECPQELDEKALLVAAEAAYMAFQRDVRRSNEYLPEPRPFSETEAYLRDCYVEMCRAAFAAYSTAVPADGQWDDPKTFWQKWAAKRLETSRKHWLRAAKRAFGGDLRELRLRVELAEAPPMQIVASEGSGQNLADATPKIPQPGE